MIPGLEPTRPLRNARPAGNGKKRFGSKPAGRNDNSGRKPWERKARRDAKGPVIEYRSRKSDQRG